jgi:formylglycine-generating enzyme required for sulfatase activity
MTNLGRANETPTITGIGLVHANNTTVNGPRRVGSTFTGSTDRIYAGASYYGVADLGGNLWEYSNKPYAANAFLRTDYGDGTMVTTYPAIWVTYPGFRGGSYAESIQYCGISDRTYVYNYSSSTNFYTGGRGVR